MTGAQIIINPGFFLIATIYKPWKMKNRNQHGTRITVLGVIIGRCSLNSQHAESVRLPANVGCSYFRYTNKNQSNNVSERHQKRKWRREDNKKVIDCHFKYNATWRRFRKWMMENWTEWSKFNTSQLIFIKVLLPDIDIQEICVNHIKQIKKSLLNELKQKILKTKLLNPETHQY